MVEVEVKEGDEGQTHRTSCAQRTSCCIELNIIKCDGSHWRRDFRTKSELHFKNCIPTMLCIEMDCKEMIVETEKPFRILLK